MDDLRVAVVGAGPAGIYAAASLTAHEHVAVDVIDRLPTPFGLVRYGVAPDHVKMKSVTTTLRRTLQHERVRFLGNIELGADLAVTDLQRHYDAVLVSSGAAADRRLGVAGEHLPGSFSATEFVSWYSGHPDTALDAFTLAAEAVVIIGVGNVALDVARVLLKTADELQTTDIPDHALDVLTRSRVRKVTIVGRRGPAHARFTTKELHELGELAGADVEVEPEELELDEAAEAVLAANSVARRNLDVLREWSQRAPQGRPRRLRLRFGLHPHAIAGALGVEGVTFTPADGGAAVALPADMVLRSVGYRGRPTPGLPFDDRLGVIPNIAGRVTQDEVVVPGLYVAGWIKRGPSGIIGTNKRDAGETVDALLQDAPALPSRVVRDPGGLLDLLNDRGVSVVPWSGWEAIEAAETAAGQGRGAAQVKIAERSLLLAAAGRAPLTRAVP